ncbi:transposase [Streptomyces sp. NPDC046931]|uniref:transposase n=1 Tax=Streptomyces sp. NPDC046931 TaxID=3154806 RepID=UPI0033F50EDC
MMLAGPVSAGCAASRGLVITSTQGRYAARYAGCGSLLTKGEYATMGPSVRRGVPAVGKGGRSTGRCVRVCSPSSRPTWTRRRCDGGDRLGCRGCWRGQYDGGCHCERGSSCKATYGHRHGSSGSSIDGRPADLCARREELMFAMLAPASDTEKRCPVITGGWPRATDREESFRLFEWNGHSMALPSAAARFACGAHAATKAGIGPEIVHRTKQRIALDLLDDPDQSALAPPLVVADSDYGTNVAFRTGLTAQGIRWPLAVTGHTVVLTATAAPITAWARRRPSITVDRGAAEHRYRAPRFVYRAGTADHPRPVRLVRRHPGTHRQDRRVRAHRVHRRPAAAPAPNWSSGSASAAGTSSGPGSLTCPRTPHSRSWSGTRRAAGASRPTIARWNRPSLGDYESRT